LSTAPRLFALDREDGTLLAFASEDDVAAQCKGVDVRDGFWLLYADDGSPLEARFLFPEVPGKPPPSSHEFVLQRALSGRWLQERLEDVRRIEGCGLYGIDELVELLKVNRSKRVPPPRGAGEP
jgi:hypothetical protein